ncbi:MAG: elongation factor 1-beta [Nitrososphaerales archaeon]
MPNLLVRVKIMPKDAEIKPNQMLDSIKQNNQNVTVRSSREDPIAFGLVALIADFLTDDKAGAMEEIENAIRSSDTVGEFEVLGVSRISAEVKK